MDVVWILAGTCFTWKEITRDIVGMAFVPSLGVSAQEERKSDSEFFKLVHIKLTQLHDFGVCTREAFSSNPAPQPMLMRDSCPLVQSYALYLTSTALRRHVEEMGQLNTVAHESILNTMRVALQVCRLVLPRGLNRILAEALEKQILAVAFGTSMAKSRMALEGYLSRLPLSSSLDFNEDENEMDANPHEGEESDHFDIRIEMANDIKLVEFITCPSCSDVDTDAPEVRELVDVSRVPVMHVVPSQT